jgi:hypothetical protein
MQRLRLVLVLILAGLLDLGTGTLSPGAEVFEEFEEGAHGRRRLVRLASQPVPPSTGVDLRRAVAARPRTAQHQPPARAAAEAPRRVPAPPPEPASSLEDH